MEQALTILAPYIMNHLHSLPDLAEFSLVSRAVHQATGERTLLNAAWHCLIRQAHYGILLPERKLKGYKVACPLSWAAVVGAVPFCKYIIATKEIKDVTGPLILACQCNQPAVVEAISAVRSMYGLMALKTAARLGRTDCALLLIKNSVGPPCAGYAVRMAAGPGRSETIAAILSAHEIHQEDKDMALDIAISWNCSVDTARVLLDNGAVPHEEIIRATTTDGPVDMLRLLLHHGCDVQEFWLDSIRNAETFAVLWNHLREKGEWDITDGCRAFERAVIVGGATSHRGERKDFEEIIRLMLADGVDVNRREGWALTQAVIQGSLPIATLLLESGADACAVDRETLQEALDSGHCALVKLVECAAASGMLKDVSIKIKASYDGLLLSTQHGQHCLLQPSCQGPPLVAVSGGVGQDII